MAKYYNYIIMFHGNSQMEDAPIFGTIDEIKDANGKKTMHLLDPLLIPIFFAIKFCLHLPRVEMDTFDVDTIMLDKAYDLGQDINLVPDNLFLLSNIFKVKPTLILYANDCDKVAIEKAKQMECDIGVLSVNELSQELLVKIWKQLYEQRSDLTDVRIKDIDKQYLLDDDKLSFLPSVFWAHQYNKTDEVLFKIYNSNNDFQDVAKLLLEQRIHHEALMNCVNSPEQQFQQDFDEGFRKAELSAEVNVVIVLPGIQRKQQKLGNLSTVIPEDEKKAIKLLGIHRAIAKNAIYIELPIIDNELFVKLNELENYCIVGTNNNYIQRTIAQIGSIISKMLSKEQLYIIERAKHITVFSDFPFGLSILGKAEVPLLCYKEISYRPITPLTRSIQIEMHKHRQSYIGKRCKVAFAECIPDNTKDNKLIRKNSAAILETIREIYGDRGEFRYTYRETLTVDQLKTFIRENMDADILHISAHGYYDKKRNLAGIMVGEEFWMATENDFHVPQVVILSACHVSPRGLGCVCIADMFLRAGAEAVLGNFIPIDAHRNTVLISRLYTYIIEAQKGSNQYRTLSEAWAGVVATNAVYEMIESSPTFSQWMWGKNPNGVTRMIDFCNNRSKGRLKTRQIYTDTIEVIKEMLAEENMAGKFDNILNQRQYFTESFFYQWIGFPENVFLYNEIFAEMFKS